MGLVNRLLIRAYRFQDRQLERTIALHAKQIMKSQVAILKLELKRDAVRQEIYVLESEDL